jgi:hypothetical protein
MDYHILLLRLQDLFLDTSTTDAVTKSRGQSIGATAVAHIGISGWLSVGFATLMPAFFASMLTIILWGAIWEGYQYIKARKSGASKTRVLRDWLLGDLPFYTIGASSQLLWIYIALSFMPWLITTIVLVLFVTIASITFGRLLSE